MKKKILLSAVVTAVVVTGAVSIIGNSQSSVIPVSKSPIAKSLVADTGTSDTSELKQTNITSTPTKEETTIPDTSEPTTTPSPAWGVDPSNSDNYIVFDKTATMTQAGIPEDQQIYASEVIELESGWIYHSNKSARTLFSIADIPTMRIAGEDYKTNPVTQLKWANAHYGNSWKNTLSYIKTHGSL